MDRQRNQKAQNGLGGETSRVVCVFLWTHRHIPFEEGEGERESKENNFIKSGLTAQKCIYLHSLGILIKIKTLNYDLISLKPQVNYL